MSDQSIEQNNQPHVPSNTPEGLMSEMRSVLDSFESTRNEVTEFLAQVKADRSRFNQLSKSADKKNEELIAQQALVQSNIDRLKLKEESVQKIHTSLEEIRDEANDNLKEVSDSILSIQEAKERFDVLKGEAQISCDGFQSIQESINGLLGEAEERKADIDTMYRHFLVDIKNETGVVTKTCVKNQLLKFRTEIEEMKNNSIAEVNTLKKDLEKQIRSLLPHAGAAGLSAAYVEAKAKYGYVPYDGDRESKGFVYLSVGRWIANQLLTLAHYTMFIAPLLAMIYIFHDLFQDVTLFRTNLGEGATIEINSENWIFRILLSIPLGVISWFGWNSIRLNRKMFEEYNHKQRVMQLYYSFKKEVEENGTPEQKQALIGIMLNAVNDKPSLVMDNYDKSIDLNGAIANFRDMIPLGRNSGS